MSLTETPTVTTRDVLHRAADLLGEWAWCQGAAQRGDAFCALGALWFAATGEPPKCISFDHSDGDLPPLYAAGRDAFNRVGGDARWNDAPERTKADVVAKLREAAEAAA
jgi:hypothetical protein